MVLPDWCEPLPDAESMRATDRWAIEQRGVPSLDLMERAGAAVARAAEELAPDGPVAVLCGKGNNGGDGLVAARLLREAGREVAVLLVGGEPGELRGDARTNLERLPGPAPVQFGGGDTGRAAGGGGGGGEGEGAGTDDGARAAAAHGLQHSAVLVDALLGTGFSGEPRGALGAAIDALNAAAAPVVSVDAPSGVDASTGVVATRAVRAACTVTFHAAKPGLWIRPGKAHAGAVRVIDIGIPRGAPAQAGIGLIGEAVLGELPRRAGDSTKFTSGHVLLVGGSRGLTGAPRMSALAAMRAGAGYVTAYVPASEQQAVVAGAGPELMTHALPDHEGALAETAAEVVLQDAADRGSSGGALALGPGLGRTPGAFACARRLARAAPLALVLDADGLNAYAERLGELAARTAPTVLTPHAGELARLLGCTSAEIERERLRHARAAAALARAVVVLKGDDTLVAEPGGRVAVSRGASPALATAGSGDVLTGVLAALLAQGLDAFTAAAAAVCLHAQAGRVAARALGAAEGVIASDVIAALPAARTGGGLR
jgi:NAD(P)H-hydrate epimerase